MSLWYESLGTCCHSAKNKTEQIQETLRHLSMPVPKGWWQACLEDSNEIKNYSKILLEICGNITSLPNWNNFGLFVALAFSELEDITPLKYSIEQYLHSAEEVLKNRPEVQNLGGKINEILQHSYTFKLLDIMNIYSPQILPSDCKLHIACWSGSENPIDQYLCGTFEDWQSLQTKQNFRRKFIISLIQLSESDHWLFAGIFRSLNCKYNENDKLFHYKTEEVTALKEFTGRLIVTFKRPARQCYLFAEKWINDIYVSEIKAQKIVIQKFPGYHNVLISKAKLDTIVKQEISSWESSLANVAGVYIITDKTNGKQYVGSASGHQGIWQRWCEYSKNGHGENKELKELLNKKGTHHSENFQYSILEIADTHSSNEELLARESFWKDILCSRNFGYNAN